jgi:hypothetical protein
MNIKFVRMEVSDFQKLLVLNSFGVETPSFVPKLCYEYKVCENGSFRFLKAFGFE